MEKPPLAHAWQKLADHHQQIVNLRIKDQFALSPHRFTDFSLKAAGVFLDYSKNRVTKDTMQLLYDLANAAAVPSYRDAMFQGVALNVTEQRQVLHPILRDITADSRAENKLVIQMLKKITEFVDKVRSGTWHGYSGKKITDIVHLGIGGSDLGPAMVVAALHPYVTQLKVHFVSNLDATHLGETIKYLNPETTLFVIVSKTFTTQETLANALSAKEWLLNKAAATKDAILHHFIGVTANPERAVAFGINPTNVFALWDWVGGRFSLWSAAGISIALAVGMDNFYELLRGAYAMDQHFITAPLEQNMPIILALLGIWNINFIGATSLAVVPYDQYLSLLPAYLQQLEMESNGKRVGLDGNPIFYNTAPIVWGAVGTNSQHSFHQLLMQGTHIVPVDFIIPLHSHNPLGEHHLLLYANCLAQSQALMDGQEEQQIVAELRAQRMADENVDQLVPHKVIPGNIPSNTIVMHKIEPRTLGALLALYEHKVFVQGVIWQINSFDQWGVELGKHLANRLVPMLQGEQNLAHLDSSTQGLIQLKRTNGLG